MQTITRKLGDFSDEVFKIDLTEYQRTLADVQDVTFSIKSDKKSADDALFVRKMSAGISEMVVTGVGNLLTANVKWGENDYGGLVVKEYLAGIFVQFVGDPVADEHVDTLFKIKIEQDFLRA